MIVYHYCDIDSFYKIIVNKCIRLSDITKSNDPMEILLLSSYIKDIFKDVYDNEKARYFKASYPYEIYESLVDYFKSSFFDDSRLYNFYVFCFSEAFKGDLLSQWRGYANDAKGVSIGFEGDLLTGDEILLFDKVKYEKPLHKQIIYNAARELIKSLKSIINQTQAYEPEKIKASSIPAFNSCFLELFKNSIFIKSSFFKEEREWRICHWTDIKCDEKLNAEKIYLKNGFYLSELKFESKNNKLISYIDLNFENCINTFIKEIIIGPKSHLTASDIRQFLFYNDFDIGKITIRKSKGIYR